MRALLVLLAALRHCLFTAMIVLLDLCRLVAFGLRSRRALAAENLFLRKQLALFQERKVPRMIKILKVTALPQLVFTILDKRPAGVCPDIVL